MRQRRFLPGKGIEDRIFSSVSKSHMNRQCAVDSRLFIYAFKYAFAHSDATFVQSVILEADRQYQIDEVLAFLGQDLHRAQGAAQLQHYLFAAGIAQRIQ